MHFTEVRIHSYKSFEDSGPIPLAKGINLFTGRNNVGKTALVEALSLKFSQAHFRGTKGPSHVDCKLSVSATDLQLAVSGGQPFSVPVPNDGRSSSEVINILSRATQIPVAVTIGQHTSPISGRSTILDYDTDRRQSSYWRWSNGKFITANQSTTAELGPILVDQFKHRIYAFRAERMNIGRSQAGASGELASDARNLPEVLSVLQHNSVRFGRYNELLRRVLPQLNSISVKPVDNNHVEIFVWEEKTEDESRAFPLAVSGTGISQVLAMLYIITTAQWPRVILIDEPNSFLHPGATRALFEVFREHPQHQYIVTTHSPELISASDPSTLALLTKERGQPTKVQPLQLADARDMRAVLTEVGARLSDVLGAERVLWVEGKTEEDCFKLIVRQLLNQSLIGTVIVGVLQTGDLEGKDADRIVIIYKRLSAGAALIPPTVGFIFDRELRTDQELEDLRRLSRGAVEFIGRRTYECYLLVPEAITAVLAAAGVSPTPTTDRIAEWLQSKRANPAYNKDLDPSKQGRDEFVDAPSLLSALFAEFSSNTLEYRKTIHSRQLTEWIIEHEPERLRELGEILARKLSPTPTG